MNAPLSIPVRSRTAFTLIELLMVVAIIGVLAGILIPVVGKIRQSARNTTVMANLKTIGQAVQVYATENKASLPRLSRQNFQRPYWPERIAPYFATNATGQNHGLSGTALYAHSTVFDNPFIRDGQHHAISDFGANTQVLVVNAEEPSGTGAAIPGVRMTNIPNPSRTVMIMPAVETLATNPADNNSTWYVNGGSLANVNTQAFGATDYGTGVVPVVFIDGHTAMIAVADFNANKRALLLLNP